MIFYLLLNILNHCLPVTQFFSSVEEGDQFLKGTIMVQKTCRTQNLPAKIFLKMFMVSSFLFSLVMVITILCYTHAYMHPYVPLLLAYSCGRKSGLRCLQPMEQRESFNLISSRCHANSSSFPFKYLPHPSLFYSPPPVDCT